MTVMTMVSESYIPDKVIKATNLNHSQDSNEISCVVCVLINVFADYIRNQDQYHIDD